MRGAQRGDVQDVKYEVLSVRDEGIRGVQRVVKSEG